MSGKPKRPASAAPPDPTPEQLAEWRALVERVQADDESGVTAWPDGKDAGGQDGAAYRILTTQRTLEQVAAAPPAVWGNVVGIVAVLRVDPVAATVAFTTRLVGEVHRALLAGERGVLTYQVIVWRQLVILLDLTVTDGQVPPPSSPVTPAKEQPTASHLESPGQPKGR
jgi:hypothetical protein